MEHIFSGNFDAKLSTELIPSPQLLMTTLIFVNFFVEIFTFNFQFFSCAFSNSLIALMVCFLQVVTQYYRAPELLAGATHYGQEGMFNRKDEVVPTVDSAYLAYKGVSYLLTYINLELCPLCSFTAPKAKSQENA